jgi:hypothetical protein
MSMDKEESEVFYVSITNAHHLRRDILEVSKMIIECLQRYEKFKRFRAERIRAMEQLIMLFRGINDLAAQLKINMPKIKLPAQKKVPKKDPATGKPLPLGKKTLPVQPQFTHESEDELKKLEAAIAQIEARLNEIK